MLNPLLTKNYIATTAVGANLIVKFGATDGSVVQAAAATDASIGVTTSLPAGAGERCDVIRNGVAEVIYGGNVTRGDALTSDANGKAIKATAVAQRVIGFAEVSGAANDVGAVRISPCINAV
jgi:hypothetical protein